MNVNGVSAYHSSSVARTVLIAEFIGMVVAACVYLVAMELLSRRPNLRSYRAVLAAVFLTLICLANRYMLAVGWTRIERRLRPGMAINFIRPWPAWGVLIAGLLMCALLWLCTRITPRLSRGIFGAGRIVLLSAGLLGVIALVNMGRGWHAHANDGHLEAMHERSAQEEVEHPRVVWIILDELAYRQAFEQRDPGLKLPALDALKSKSYVYTNVRPVGYFTDLVVPSLLLGTQVDEMRYNFSSGLKQLHHSDGQWHAFEAKRSVIGEADARGWNTGITGWWNPYCWLFAGSLQSCSWQYVDASYGVMRSRKSVTKNLVSWLRNVAGEDQGIPLLTLRVRENDALQRHASALLNDDRMDFVMIHLAMPHAPFVYDRQTGKAVTTPGRSYLDGLANADVALGELMQQIQSSPRWANTTLVVQGDHSWRTPMWVHEPGWTPEDQRISDGGKFDDRPVLLVHAPGQTEGVTVTEPVSLMKVHDVITSVLENGEPKNLPK